MKWNGFGRMAVSAVAIGAACLAWTGGSATAGPARAGQTRAVTCGTVSGVNSDDHRLILSGCTGPTGGYGSFQGPMHSSFTVHWASDKSTDVSFSTHDVESRSSSCPGEVKLTGKVTETSISEFSRTFSGLLCIDSTHHVTLAPGTRIRF